MNITFRRFVFNQSYVTFATETTCNFIIHWKKLFLGNFYQVILLKKLVCEYWFLSIPLEWYYHGKLP